MLVLRFAKLFNNYFCNNNLFKCKVSTHGNRTMLVLMNKRINNGEINTENAPHIILYLVQHVRFRVILKLRATDLNVNDVVNQCYEIFFSPYYKKIIQMKTS